MVYRTYREYLEEVYGERVYKLPVNLPVTCPNRDGSKGTGGCVFCAGVGAGFEALPNTLSVKEQLLKNKEYIGKKYRAEKFIAYFQNFTNTYQPVDAFRSCMEEALLPGVVEISVSTRPDCLGEDYLDALCAVREKGVRVSLELGLQSASDDTLRVIRRGHTVGDFCDAAVRAHAREIPVCAHLIVNLPWDSAEDVLRAARLLNEYRIEGVKLHSLYVVRDTLLGEWYERGEVAMIPYEEYKERTISFLEQLRPETVIQRLCGRAPERWTLFENYGRSWRWVHDDIVRTMEERGAYQGKKYREESGKEN